MLRYIELKTGFNDDGPAWIARVVPSKSGRTLYFDGKALKRLKGGGASSNFFDSETGEEYWVSGVKRRGSSRLHAGSGKIHVEASAVTEFLAHRSEASLDASQYVVSSSIRPTDPSTFVAHENSKRAPGRLAVAGASAVTPRE